MKKTLATFAALAVITTTAACGSDNKVTKVTDSAKSAGVSVTSSMGAGNSSSASAPDSSSAASSESASSSSSESSSGASDSSASESSASGSSSPSGSAAALPSGDKLVTSKGTKISFAVPQDWKVVDVNTLDETKLEAAFATYAKNTGQSASSLASAAKNSFDLYVFAPAPKNNFMSNINVNKNSFPKSQGLPSKKALDDTFAKEGATGDSYTKVQTPLGEGANYSYTMKMSGSEVHGVSVMVPNGQDGYSIITVSAGDSATASKIAQDIDKTLQAAK